MATTKKPVAMCCVKIGYDTFLMPSDKGLRVVELLQSAVECREEYGNREYIYYVQDQPRVSLAMVKPSQVRQATPETHAGGRPRLIEG